MEEAELIPFVRKDGRKRKNYKRITKEKHKNRLYINDLLSFFTNKKTKSNERKD
jgi:hypothetical protein